jgi:chemotaxis protein MotB
MPIKPRETIDINDPRVSRFGHPAPPWLVNYADLMTELVCFFIILYALSAALSKNMVNAKEKLEEIMKDQKIQGEVKMTKEGLYLTLEEQGGAVYFESGKSEITQQGKDLLEKVVPVFKGLPNDIVIEGHTDDVPIHNSQFTSNWELSTARATNIVRYLASEDNFPPQRLSAIGYGEYKPKVPNDGPESRGKNRRVVFFIKNK